MKSFIETHASSGQFQLADLITVATYVNKLDYRKLDQDELLAGYKVFRTIYKQLKRGEIKLSKANTIVIYAILLGLNNIDTHNNVSGYTISGDTEISNIVLQDLAESSNRSYDLVSELVVIINELKLDALTAFELTEVIQALVVLYKMLGTENIETSVIEEDFVYASIVQTIEYLERQTDIPAELLHLKIECLYNLRSQDPQIIELTTTNQKFTLSGSVTIIDKLASLWPLVLHLRSMQPEFTVPDEFSLSTSVPVSTNEVAENILTDLIYAFTVIIVNHGPTLAQKYIPIDIADSILNTFEHILSSGTSVRQAATLATLLDFAGKSQQAREMAQLVAPYLMQLTDPAYKRREEVDFLIKLEAKIHQLLES
jgi:hypothetical protein